MIAVFRPRFPISRRDRHARKSGGGRLAHEHSSEQLDQTHHVGEFGGQVKARGIRRRKMSIRRSGPTLVAGAVALGVSCLGSAAWAADMPVKAPPPAPAAEFDVHGFIDVSFKNDYITPRGLLVTNTGLTTQVLAGMAWDAYKDKAGFINLVSFYGGVWNDIWSDQVVAPAVGQNNKIGNWNEFDWFFGMSVKF